MKFIYLLIFSAFLLATNCKSNSPKVTANTNPAVDNTVELLKDTLVQIADRQLLFAKGNSKTLPFSDDAATTTLILVRHAEKASGGEDPDDPDLTPAGVQRAERLADILQDFPLDGVYTNYFERTTKTAQPSAYQAQVDIQFYDHEKAADFIIQLAARELGKNFLIVGRANTVPQMLNRLLGEARFKDINEADYSNIYVVSIGKNGEIKVTRALF
ncbi:MAG: phosphoglycerate mutase family protein [Saprospiraceae bacterium]